jgi:hypothetical protein
MAPKSNWKPYAKSLIAAPIAIGVAGALVWYGVSRTREADRKYQEEQQVGASEHRDSHEEQHHEDAASHAGKMHEPGHENRAPRIGKTKVSAYGPATPSLSLDSVLPLARQDYAALPGCAASELQGAGMQMPAVSAGDWELVMESYHEAKAGLLAWLQGQRGKIAPKLFARMESEVRELRVQRPPNADEPDLSWRGIVVLTDDSEGPLVRLGGGVVALVKNDPRRAGYEFTRVIAQRWSACSLAAHGGGALWAKLGDCMGVREDPAISCVEGGYSESGWMVATTLASRIASPGCRVAGVAQSLERAECKTGRAPAALQSVGPGKVEPAPHAHEEKHEQSSGGAH